MAGQLNSNSESIFAAIESRDINLLEILLNRYPENLMYAYKRIKFVGGMLRTTPLEHICWKRAFDANPILVRMHNLVLRLLRARGYPELPPDSFVCKYAPIVASEPAANRPAFVANRPAVVQPAGNGHVMSAVPIPARRGSNLYVSPPESPARSLGSEDENVYAFAANALIERVNRKKGGVRKTKKSRKNRRTRRRLLR
jgi:hypothetical protein